MKLIDRQPAEGTSPVIYIGRREYAKKDAAVILRRAMQYSMMSVRKNRFGPPMLRMIPLRIDPVTTRLVVSPSCDPQRRAAYRLGGNPDENHQHRVGRPILFQ